MWMYQYLSIRVGVALLAAEVESFEKCRFVASVSFSSHFFNAMLIEPKSGPRSIPSIVHYPGVLLNTAVA